MLVTERLFQSRAASDDPAKDSWGVVSLQATLLQRHAEASIRLDPFSNEKIGNRAIAMTRARTCAGCSPP